MSELENVVGSGSVIEYPGIKSMEELETPNENEILTISPERLAAISKPSQAKKDKPKFPHTCTRCGKVWEMPIQLDPTRPMYCAECRPLVAEERNKKGFAMQTALAPTISPSSIDLEDVIPTGKTEVSLQKTYSAIEDRSMSWQDVPPPRPPRAMPSGTIKIVRADAGKSSDEDDPLFKQLQQPRTPGSAGGHHRRRRHGRGSGSTSA